MLVMPAKKYGFFDCLFSNPDEAWHIKLDSLFKPNPFVLGTKLQSVPRRAAASSSASFGYRRLEPNLALELLGNMGDDDDEAAPRSSNLLSVLRSIEPTVPRPGENYAEGPFVYTHQNVFAFSDEHKSVEETLTSELLKLMRNRYPSYG